MDRFYRGFIITIAVFGLVIFLVYRFIDNYTSTMHRMYSPNEFEEHDESEEDEVSDTSTYAPENQK